MYYLKKCSKRAVFLRKTFSQILKMDIFEMSKIENSKKVFPKKS